MALKGECAPREAHAKFAWPPLLRRSLFFFTLFSVLPPLLRQPLQCINPFLARPPFASTPSCIDPFCMCVATFLCRKSQKRWPPATTPRNYRFCHAKSGGISEGTDSVFGAGFAQLSVDFLFKNGVEPKIGAAPCQSVS